MAVVYDPDCVYVRALKLFLSDEPDSYERLRTLTFSLLEKEGFDCGEHVEGKLHKSEKHKTKAAKTDEHGKSKFTVKEESSSSTFVAGAACEIEEEIKCTENDLEKIDTSCEIIDPDETSQSPVKHSKKAIKEEFEEKMEKKISSADKEERKKRSLDASESGSSVPKKRSKEEKERDREGSKPSKSSKSKDKEIDNEEKKEKSKVKEEPEVPSVKRIKSNKLSKIRDNLSDAESISLKCSMCLDDISEERNKIVHCKRCQKTFHQECHKPPIADSLIANGTEWTCRLCTLQKIEKQTGNAASVDGSVSTKVSSSKEQTEKPKTKIKDPLKASVKSEKSIEKIPSSSLSSVSAKSKLTSVSSSGNNTTPSNSGGGGIFSNLAAAWGNLSASSSSGAGANGSGNKALSLSSSTDNPFMRSVSSPSKSSGPADKGGLTTGLKVTDDIFNKPGSSLPQRTSPIAAQTNSPSSNSKKSSSLTHSASTSNIAKKAESKVSSSSSASSSSGSASNKSFNPSQSSSEAAMKRLKMMEKKATAKRTNSFM
ncbi:uncharacterized protein LOC142348160 isoform X2 [Convolutriloba macropyga]